MALWTTRRSVQYLCARDNCTFRTHVYEQAQEERAERHMKSHLVLEHGIQFAPEDAPLMAVTDDAN
jgi:cytosine/adenosine deaminase-related metal-dependent hydrolase